MFEVPFAVLATIDRKAQKESFCLVGVFVVEKWPESFVIIGTIWIVERAASVTGPAGVLFQMFFFTQLLSRK